MHQPLIELTEVSVLREGNYLLQPTSLTMNTGEHWVLLGPNGSGKSTLLGILALGLWPSAGHMQFFGERLPGNPVFPIQRNIGIFETRDAESLAQNYPHLTLLDVVLFGVTGKLPLYSQPSDLQIQQAKNLLQRFLGLDLSHAARFCNLSSGERRRVLLIRALAASPEILLLDEPFESLDIGAQYSIQDLLAELVMELKSSILVLHRIQEIPQYASHAGLMKDGHLWKSGRISEVINSGNLTETYGIPLEVRLHNGKYEWSRT